MKLKGNIDNQTMTFKGAAVLIPIYGTFLIIVELAKHTLEAIIQLQEGNVDIFFWSFIVLICVSLVYMGLTATYTPSSTQLMSDEDEVDTAEPKEAKESKGGKHKQVVLLVLTALLVILSLSGLGSLIAQLSISFSGYIAVVALCGLLLFGLGVINIILRFIVLLLRLLNNVKQSYLSKGQSS